MISINELKELKEGTLVYVAAAIAAYAPIWFTTNSLSEESFVCLQEIHSRLYLKTVSGGYNLSGVGNGKNLFLNKADAEQYMHVRHLSLHAHKLSKLESDIEKLQAQLRDLQQSGPGEPDYIYHERA